MKLIIQIPCFNEENQLANTIKALPKKIDGISEIKTLVINDGSDDNTVDVAIDNGIDFIVSHNINRGLAQAFSTGLNTCLKLGADVIVNTDADNQYDANNIKDIIKPILEKKSDIVIGSRPIDTTDDFSFVKKRLQRLGSFVVSKLAGINIPDATSGFRAYSRHSAENLNVISKFTYTLETIIQASHRNIIISSIDIKTNRKTRESRLFRNNFQYVIKSISDIISITLQVRPLLIIGSISSISLFIGFLIGIRFILMLFIHDFSFENNTGYIQSLILAAVFLIFGSVALLIGFLSDQLAGHRIFLERIVLQIKQIENNALTPISNIKNLIYKKKED